MAMSQRGKKGVYNWGTVDTRKSAMTRKTHAKVLSGYEQLILAWIYKRIEVFGVLTQSINKTGPFFFIKKPPKTLSPKKLQSI